MKLSSRTGFFIIALTYLPVLFRLTYTYDEWYIYALKMTVDTSYISFAWLIASGFRQGFVRRMLSQSMHGKFHNYLGYTILIAILVHPIAYIFLWSDWRVVFPFIHPYGILVSLGSIAIILGLIIGLSSYFIRKRYYDLWNATHYLAYVMFILVFIHVWQSLPLTSPTGVYYIIVFVLTVVVMLYKFAFDLQLLSYKVPILEIEEVGKDTYNVRFEVPDIEFETWESGQYMMVAIDATDDNHPFSVSRINSDGTAEITFKVFGDFTRKFAQCKNGDTLYLTGPYGTASKMVNNSDDDLVLIAGGIGVTPFRCIIHSLLEAGSKRHITLFYCVSDIGYFAFDNEFAELANQYDNFDYVKMCSRGSNQPDILEGYISAEIISEHVKSVQESSYIVCGPDAMLAAVNTMLRFHDVPRYRIHKEEFSY